MQNIDQRLLEKLNKYINQNFQDKKPNKQQIYQLNEIYQSLNDILQNSKSFKLKYEVKLRQKGQLGYKLLKFGSSINSSYKSDTSDLDLTFITNNLTLSHKKMLEDVMSVLSNQNYKRFSIHDNMPRLDSSGWILKIKDNHTKINIDLMVNKTSQILNSHLIMEYSRIDSRFHKLIYLLKDWNHNPSSKFHKFNNYSLILMLISFMQSQKMIPNLQARSENFDQLIINQQLLKKNNDKQNDLFIDICNSQFDSFQELYMICYKVELIYDYEGDEKDFCPFDLLNLNYKDFDLYQNSKKFIFSPAEILLKFLKFYGNLFMESQNENLTLAIDIQQQVVLKQKIDLSSKKNVIETYYAGKPYVKQFQMIKKVKDDFKSEKYFNMFFGEKKNQDDFQINLYDKNIENLEWLYQRLEKQIKNKLVYVVDPFDKSYNPAKSVGKYENMFMVWKISFQELMNDNCDYQQIKLY